MSSRDSLIRLTREIEKIIDDELDRPPVKHLWSVQPIPQRVEVAIFQVDSYKEVKGSLTPIIGWMARPGFSYSERSVEEFISRIQHSNVFRDSLSKVNWDETYEGYETGLLYLTAYVYYVTKRLLYKYPVEAGKLVDDFLKDVAEKNLSVKVKVGVVGVAAPGGHLEIAPGVVLRNQDRTDFWDRMEELNRRLIDSVPFPSSLFSSSVLEISIKSVVKKKSDTGFSPYGFSYYTSIRSFDSIIISMRDLTTELIDTLSLIQSDLRPDTEFLRVELYLPNLSPDDSVYEYSKFRTSPLNGRSLELSEDSKVIVDLINKLLSVDYRKRINETDDGDSPLSFAYKKYLEIIDFSGNIEELIEKEISGLEKFFTPEHSLDRLFIERLSLIIRQLGIDENDTVNVLYNAYLIRSSFTHRGPGWKAREEQKSSVDRVEDHNDPEKDLNRYEYYLSKLLKEYFRISIVSRILSGMDDSTYINELTKAAQLKLKFEILEPQKGYFSAKIQKIFDFVNLSYTGKYGLFPLYVSKLIEKGKIQYIKLEIPSDTRSVKTVFLVSKDELEYYRLELSKGWRHEAKCARELEKRGYRVEIYDTAERWQIYWVEKTSNLGSKAIKLQIMWKGETFDPESAGLFEGCELDSRIDAYMFCLDALDSYWIFPSEILVKELEVIIKKTVNKSTASINLLTLSRGRLVPFKKFDQFRNEAGIEVFDKMFNGNKRKTYS